MVRLRFRSRRSCDDGVSETARVSPPDVLRVLLILRQKHVLNEEALERAIDAAMRELTLGTDLQVLFFVLVL